MGDLYHGEHPADMTPAEAQREVRHPPAEQQRLSDRIEAEQSRLNVSLATVAAANDEGVAELRDQVGRELIGWDNQMSPEAIAHPNNAAFFAHWLDVTDPNDGEQAKHYQAGIDMILRLAPTFATVAAANDEGFARGVEAAAKVADEYEQHTGDPAFDAATDVAAVTIAERIRLLPQGGGKA